MGLGVSCLHRAHVGYSVRFFFIDFAVSCYPEKGAQGNTPGGGARRVFHVHLSQSVDVLLVEVLLLLEGHKRVVLLVVVVERMPVVRVLLLV